MKRIKLSEAESILILEAVRTQILNLKLGRERKSVLTNEYQKLLDKILEIASG
jgi:hypothetical protein